MHRTVATTCGALVALACLISGTAAEAGSVTGKITYDDVVPTLRPVAMDADPACAAKHSSPVLPDILVVGKDKGLGNVFVAVKNPPAGNHAAPKTPVVIDQNGCHYTPHVVGLLAGQELKFKNSDGILHNVHGLPKENREFNIGMPPAVKEKGQVLNKPEAVFPVKCDVHPWMKAYVAVMTHPYFDVTGADGAFKIDGLPAGSYDIEAWHERLGTQTAKLTVGADGSGSTNFSFKKPSK